MEIGRAVPQLFQANAAQARVSSSEYLFGGKPLDLQAKPELVQEGFCFRDDPNREHLCRESQAAGNLAQKVNLLSLGIVRDERPRWSFHSKVRAVRNSPKHSATERRLACSAWASDAEAFARLDLQVYTAQYPRARLFAKSGIAPPEAINHKRHSGSYNPFKAALSPQDAVPARNTTRGDRGQRRPNRSSARGCFHRNPPLVDQGYNPLPAAHRQSQRSGVS